MSDDLVARLLAYEPRSCWVCGEWGCKDEEVYRSDGSIDVYFKLEITDPAYLERYRCGCLCHDTRLMNEAAAEITRLRGD